MLIFTVSYLFLKSDAFPQSCGRAARKFPGSPKLRRCWWDLGKPTCEKNSSLSFLTSRMSSSSSPMLPGCFMMYSVSFWFEKARAGFLKLSRWGKVFEWYGELNKNGSRNLMDLNAWFHWWDCWKGLGGAAVLEEVCHWLGGFKSPYNSDLDLVLSIGLWISSELSATASTQCLPAALLAMVMFMGSTMGPMSPLKCFFL